MWGEVHRLTPSHKRIACVAGLIHGNFLMAREMMLEWIKTEIETIIDVRRIASVEDDVNTLALEILKGHITYKLARKLLGGRKPSSASERGKSIFGTGAWGDEVPFAVSVVEMAKHLGNILHQVWGKGAGSPMGTEDGFGIERVFREAVASLSEENTGLLAVDFFQRAGLGASRFRTRRGAPPVDWAECAQTSEALKLNPAVDEQNAEAAASQIAAKVATEVATQIAAMAAAAAGQKRPYVAAAAAGLQTGLATQASGGAPPSPVKGAPGVPGAPGTGKEKRRLRAEAHAAAKMAGAAGAPPATAGAAGAPPATGLAQSRVTQSAVQAAVASPAAVPTAVVTHAATAAAGGGGGAAAGWTPTFAANTITSFINKATRDGAVEHFDYICKQAGLAAAMPCAFASLATCQGTVCRKCADQATRSPPTPIPAGAVKRVKDACTPAVALKVTRG